MRSWRLQEHQLKNLLPNWILKMWVVKKQTNIKNRTERNLFFVLSERCLLHLQARHYIKSLPKIEKKDLQKVFSTANPQGQMLGSVFWGGTASLWPESVLVPQPCLCWSACCCWTRRAGPRPLRPSLCLTSPTSEIRRKRRKRSCTTTRWTTRTCLWASGNVRTWKGGSGNNVTEQAAKTSQSRGLLIVDLNCLLFFRSHVHRDLKLQTCCVRLQRNATLNQSNRAARGPRCQFSKADGGKVPQSKS